MFEVEWEGASVVWTDVESGDVLGQNGQLEIQSAGLFEATVFYDETEVCSVVIEIEGISVASDLNGSGTVDSVDFLQFLSGFGCVESCTTDVNGDGETNVEDLLQMLVEFGSSC